MVKNSNATPCVNDLAVDSHNFLVDLFVLPLSGADIVVGVQWLKTLGPVLTYYNQLTLKFLKNGQIVQLQGEPKPDPTESSFHQLRRLVSTQAIDTYYQIHILNPSNPTEPTNFSPPIHNLLDQYSDLFTPPSTLPPHRTTDHAITLTSGADPVNVKPYRYPQFQKREIETQIKAMLEQGIIRSSCSAFSSPVLLVRKRDGSWSFCVDYRALNAITVKDRFPIPAIDELLDELYGTTWFSKLDLHSGYQQIRMLPEDIAKTTF
jgi:hypothetical protein